MRVVDLAGRWLKPEHKSLSSWSVPIATVLRD